MEICQTRLPLKPWLDPAMRRLPGVAPVGKDEWLLIDEVYGPQMAYADRLIATRRDDVFACEERAPVDRAAAELLRDVIDWVLRQPGFARRDGHIERPDGETVPLTGAHPLLTARRLVQEDLILHLPGEQGDGGHRLVGGALAFPAGWTLAEKMSRSLKEAHGPVPSYDDDVARRVQRLFDGLQPGRPLMRANWLRYDAADLFQPHTEHNRRKQLAPRFIRVERQCLRRLVISGAVVFSIHTFVLPGSALPPTEWAASVERD